MDMPAVGEIVLYRPRAIEHRMMGDEAVPFLVIKIEGVKINGRIDYQNGFMWHMGIPAGDTPGTWRFKPPQIRTS